MTDDQIADLLGWTKNRTHRDSSLLHRIRLIVAEAQAEQSAQIERMRAALVDVRVTISLDRMATLDAHTDSTGVVDADGRSEAAVYDEILARIDAALEEES